ncbi:MAG TPA: FtsX-like permease family protein [Actinomycetes bacterium]
MSTSLRDRPAELDAGPRRAGMPARRAVVRWAWRLFRREWRQQLLLLGLLGVAVAATVVGVAVSTNTPSSPAATFGTANHLLTLPGSDPHLAADLAAIRQHFGAIEVIGHQRLATGSVNPIDLRAQDPRGPYGSPMLRLVAGRYPAGADEVAVTRQVATLYNLHVGDRWNAGGHARRVVGLVENPLNLLDAFALVAPGPLGAPTQVTVLFDASDTSVSSFAFPGGVSPQTPPPPPAGFSPAIVVLAVAIFGLIFIGLVAVAGFTVMAQRRLRALGMLSALGATDRDVRLVLLANGAVVGLVAALAGAAAGWVAWIAYAPRLQAGTGHRIDRLNLPWWAIGTAMALAVVTAVVAARGPARSVARMPVVAALSGRPATPKATRRSAVPGAVLLVAGLCLLAFAGGWSGGSAADQLKLLSGIVATTLGALLLAPVCITVLAVAGRQSPVAVRLALHDLARYRTRSGAALAAVTFAVVVAVLTCILATARFADPVDYFGPNLPANQLVVYAPDHTPGVPSNPGSAQAAAAPRSLRSRVNSIAAALGTHDVLELDAPINPATAATVQLQQSTTSRPRDGGRLYVATPALLAHYGIDPNTVDPNADLLSSRPGLASTARLQLSGFLPGLVKPGGPGDAAGSDHSGCAPGSAPGGCVANPAIQTRGQLPTDTADPNLLITTHGMDKLGSLGLQAVPSAWIIQTARPLTAFQINAARQLAVAAGATIETKSQNPSLDALRNWATVAGILLALGVLAMTVGLIRSETAGELRSLTATGASGWTRRTLTSATAGALALLGALIGTATAYLAAIAWYRSSLATTVRHVPVGDLAVILAGLPLAATIGGWLFAGREPPAIARQPLE